MPRYILNKFTEVRLADYSSVVVEFDLADCAFDRNTKILRARCSGSYGYGSDGNEDAIYMEAMLKAAIKITNPRGLVLDFSGLDYQWGDRLSGVIYGPLRHLGCHEPWPFALVLGEGCEAAVLSLLEDEGVPETSLDYLFRDMEQAQHFVQQRLQEHDLAQGKEEEERKHKNGVAFWKLLGPELGPEQCRSPGCERLRVKDSWLCRVHHYEQYHDKPCPFS